MENVKEKGITCEEEKWKEVFKRFSVTFQRNFFWKWNSKSIFKRLE